MGSAMSKDIRCFFGRHMYSDEDMVLKLIYSDEQKVKFSVKKRCVRCGRVRKEVIEIPKQGKGVQ